MSTDDVPAVEENVSRSITTPKTVVTPPEIVVTVQILSNWGHPTRVGLTELQLFDKSGKKLELDVADVFVHGAVNPKGQIKNIINGNFKVLNIMNIHLILKGIFIDRCDDL